MAHILLSIQGTLGDVVPILHIGSILKAAGNSVTLITRCAYEQLARQAGLEFAAFDTPQEFERYIVWPKLWITLSIRRQFANDASSWPIRHKAMIR